jgi:hypothetical protein
LKEQQCSLKLDDIGPTLNFKSIKESTFTATTSSSASQIWSVSGERCDYVGYGGSGNTLTNLGATLKFRLTTLIKPCSRRLQKSIHNGYTAKFWTTHWAHGNSLVSVFPALFSHSRKKNRTIAEAMAGDTWIKDLMHNVTPNIVADYIRLWMVISGLNFDPSDTRSDEIVWLWSASGEYTAKSAYRMEFQGSTRSNFRALIWQVWAPSRCKFSIWLMLQNRV